MELFDYLNALTHKKEDLDFNNDEVRKGYNNYIINRFISMSEVYVPVVDEINRYDLPKSTHFRYFHAFMPKRKHYFKYIKKHKDLTVDEKKIIAKHFEVGLRDAEKYIEVLDQKELNSIIELYKYGKNQLAI